MRIKLAPIVVPCPKCNMAITIIAPPLFGYYYENKEVRVVMVVVGWCEYCELQVTTEFSLRDTVKIFREIEKLAQNDIGEIVSFSKAKTTN
ncbi:MAG: hypothetical protein KatS3mg098_238 [Candidatus Parcubacteria bacterium]|nr:MAG: hypothetical protein KatS3mg098_238 [Candidatus Parcubacteria bacterium]